MKICFLAPASSIHSVKWANAMAELHIDTSMVTMHPAVLDELNPKIKIHELKFKSKFGYYLNKYEAKKVIQKINPDLLHVHFASGYGTLARLVGFKPTLLSVWGSDVYLFPYQSKRNKKILIKNLSFSDKIASTSVDMKKQTEKFIEPELPIEVTPFGINLDYFLPSQKQNDDDHIVIGTVKSLKTVYGIDILIHATKKLIERLKSSGKMNIANKIKLRIVGDGEELTNLKNITSSLGMTKITEFVGAVPNHEVPSYLNQFDIYCALSRSESFGVAVLEASACEVPVIVSRVGGLPEVVKHDETGFIVDHNNLDEIVDKLYFLTLNKEARQEMGKLGREFVLEKYEWKQNVLKMLNIYKSIIEEND